MQKFDYVLFVLGTAMTLAGSVALCAQAYEMRHAYQAAVFGLPPSPSSSPLLAGAEKAAFVPCGNSEVSNR